MVGWCRHLFLHPGVLRCVSFYISFQEHMFGRILKLFYYSISLFDDEYHTLSVLQASASVLEEIGVPPSNNNNNEWGRGSVAPTALKPSKRSSTLYIVVGISS